MRRFERKQQPGRTNRAERPCWREILDVAFAGLTPADQQIERLLDHLEQTR